MIRRNILKGIGALIALPAAGKPPPRSTSMAMLGGGLAAPSGSAASGESPLVRSLKEQVYAARYREFRTKRVHERTVQLLGGYPPHLVALQSVSPTWRAARAAKWADAEERRLERFTDALARRLGLSPNDWAYEDDD